MTKLHTPIKNDFSWKTLFLQTIYFIRETPLSWFFGFMLSFPVLAIIITESLRSQFQETDIPLMTSGITGMFFLILFLFFIGEAGLILSFRKNIYSPLEHMAATGALIRWYFLLLLLLLSFFALFFSPFLIAPPEARLALKYIGLIFFFLVVCVTFVLKMFGEFYLILSRLSVRNALREAAGIFTNHFRQSFLFLFITSLLSILAGFISSTIHTLIHFPFMDGVILNTILISFILVFSSFFHIFFRALWYFFFQSLAAEKPSDWQKEKKVVEESMVPAEDEA